MREKPDPSKQKALTEEIQMFRIGTTLRLSALAVSLGIGLSSCAATAPSIRSSEAGPSQSSRAAEHRRAQRQKAIDGGYQRLYRPKGCRSSTASCDGFPRMSFKLSTPGTATT
ncbi:MAG: hypothetical protein EOP17_04610 [Rhizobiaceae bacterium]|nr:MAG: hypothetical protein EOP17_04610 [Rhizobiaceae bacterium]